MNKPFDPKKPGKIAAVDAPQVPAQPRLPSKWKQFRCLMNDLDEIRERYDDLADLMVDMRNRKPGEPPPDLRYAQLLDYDKQKLTRCRLWLKEIDCADHYENGDEDDEQPILRKKTISERLALMLGAVHIGGPQTPEAFVKMLLQHVYDAEVSYLALESGCREIEQKQKYVPTISEVLEVLKEHREQWNERKYALGNIELRSNYLQEQIRQAEAKYERERAVKQLEEANLRLTSLQSRLKQDAKQIVEAQERAGQAHQNVEAAMNQLAKNQADGALVLALLKRPNERKLFHCLMGDLNWIRDKYDEVIQVRQCPGGGEPPDLRDVQLNIRYKLCIARCRQWLPEIDRAEHYEEGERVLTEDTISKRLSVMLGKMHNGAPQDPAIFLQNLSQQVYDAEIAFPALESACREIEQTGKCPTIPKVLETLKAHEKQWDKGKLALHCIEAFSDSLQQQILHKRQEEAREAYQRVEAAMERLAKDQQSCAEAKAALDAPLPQSKPPQTR